MQYGLAPVAVMHSLIAIVRDSNAEKNKEGRNTRGKRQTTIRCERYDTMDGGDDYGEWCDTRHWM